MTKILDMNTTSTVNISNTSTVTTSNYDMIHEYANESEVETSIDTTVKDESTGSFLDNVVNWCSDRVEDVVEGAKQVGEAVGEAVKDVAQAVKPVGEAVVDWCSDRVEDAVDWCSDRKQELTNWWDDVCTDWDKKSNGYNFTYDKYIENDYSQFAGILTMESINESLELKNSLLADMYYNDNVISYYENLDYELSLIYPGYATSDWYGLTAEEYAYALYLKDLGTGMGEEWANDPERVKAREEAVNSMVEFMEGYTSQLGYDSYDAFVEDYNKRKEVIAALNEDNYNRQRAMDLIPYQAIYDSEAFQNATVDTKYDYSKSDPFTTLETIEMIENSNHPLYSRYGFNSREEFDEFKILYYMSEEDRKMYFYLKENVPNEATNFLEANVDAANRTAGEIKAVKELSEAGIITLKDDIDTTNVKHPEILMENYEISDQNAFLSYCAGFGLGVKDGVIQWGDGIENFFCNDGIKSVQDYKVQYLSQMLAQATGAKMFLDETYQLGSSIGNMLPTIALGELAGVAYGAQVAQTVSSISMFVSTAGNETERARQNYNCSTFEAYLYGSIIGASEVGLERVLGTISPIANKEATNVLTAFTGEFEEEFVQTYIEAFVQAGMFGEDIDLSTLTADALKSGVMGGLTGSMFYGGNFICTNVNSGVTYIFSSPEQKELINSYKQELANNPDLKLDEFIIQYGEARRTKTSMISDQANQAAIDRMSTDKYSPIDKIADSDVSTTSDLDVPDISIDSIDVMGMETDVDSSTGVTTSNTDSIISNIKNNFITMDATALYNQMQDLDATHQSEVTEFLKNNNPTLLQEYNNLVRDNTLRRALSPSQIQIVSDVLAGHPDTVSYLDAIGQELIFSDSRYTSPSADGSVLTAPIEQYFKNTFNEKLASNIDGYVWDYFKDSGIKGGSIKSYTYNADGSISVDYTTKSGDSGVISIPPEKVTKLINNATVAAKDDSYIMLKHSLDLVDKGVATDPNIIFRALIDPISAKQMWDSMTPDAQNEWIRKMNNRIEIAPGVKANVAFFTTDSNITNYAEDGKLVGYNEYGYGLGKTQWAFSVEDLQAALKREGVTEADINNMTSDELNKLACRLIAIPQNSFKGAQLNFVGIDASVSSDNMTSNTLSGANNLYGFGGETAGGLGECNIGEVDLTATNVERYNNDRAIKDIFIYLLKG